MGSADEGRRNLLRYCRENGVRAKTGKPLVRQICVDVACVGLPVPISATEDKVEKSYMAVRQLQCKHGVLGQAYCTDKGRYGGDRHTGLGTMIDWHYDIDNNLDRLPDCRRCFRAAGRQIRAAGIERGKVVHWLRKRDWKWLASMIVSLFGGLPK